MTFWRSRPSRRRSGGVFLVAAGDDPQRPTALRQKLPVAKPLDKPQTSSEKVKNLPASV
jgi:hypothetical protein